MKIPVNEERLNQFRMAYKDATKGGKPNANVEDFVLKDENRWWRVFLRSMCADRMQNPREAAEAEWTNIIKWYPPDADIDIVFKDKRKVQIFLRADKMYAIGKD